MSEDQFIQKLKAGDNDAFEALVNLYQDKIYNTCYSFLKQAELAEDQTQEIFIILFNAIQQFEAKSKLSTWIYRITVSRCLDFIRSQNRQKRKATGILSLFNFTTELQDFQEPTPYQHLENKEYAEVIARALDTMKSKNKTVFILKYMEGLSQKEIAEILNCSEKSIEGILTRSKSILKIEIEKKYPEMRGKFIKNI